LPESKSLAFTKRNEGAPLLAVFEKWAFRLPTARPLYASQSLTLNGVSLDEKVVAKTASLPELSRCEPSALSPDAAMFSRGIPSGSDDVDSWEGPLLEKREKWGTRGKYNYGSVFELVP
jgi:hypothetical protein